MPTNSVDLSSHYSQDSQSCQKNEDEPEDYDPDDHHIDRDPSGIVLARFTVVTLSAGKALNVREEAWADQSTPPREADLFGI